MVAATASQQAQDSKSKRVRLGDHGFCGFSQSRRRGPAFVHGSCSRTYMDRLFLIWQTTTRTNLLFELVPAIQRPVEWRLLLFRRVWLIEELPRLLKHFVDKILRNTVIDHGEEADAIGSLPKPFFNEIGVKAEVNDRHCRKVLMPAPISLSYPPAESRRRSARVSSSSISSLYITAAFRSRVRLLDSSRLVMGVSVLTAYLLLLCCPAFLFFSLAVEDDINYGGIKFEI